MLEKFYAVQIKIKNFEMKENCSKTLFNYHSKNSEIMTIYCKKSPVTSTFREAQTHPNSKKFWNYDIYCKKLPVTSTFREETHPHSKKFWYYDHLQPKITSYFNFSWRDPPT